MGKRFKSFLLWFIMAVGFTWFGLRFEGCGSKIVIGNTKLLSQEESEIQSTEEADPLL